MNDQSHLPHIHRRVCLFSSVVNCENKAGNFFLHFSFHLTFILLKILTSYPQHMKWDDYTDTKWSITLLGGAVTSKHSVEKRITFIDISFDMYWLWWWWWWLLVWLPFFLVFGNLKENWNKWRMKYFSRTRNKSI